MQKQGPIIVSNEKHDWALIEAPIPNAPEGKYISQIPSPTNLLTVSTALKSKNIKDIILFNFLKTRRPEVVISPNIVYNMGEATCMDFLYNYANEYLALLRHFNPKSNIWVIGHYAWLHPDKFKDNFKITEAHSFENNIIGETTRYDFPNDWSVNDWDWMKKNVCSKTKGIRVTFRASRGCPHSCVMCPVLKVYGKKVKRFSIDWVIKEIDALYYTYGIRQIGFLDDNLFFDRKWAKNLLKEIIKNNYKGLSLTFEEGLDVPTALDEELISLMKKAHFTHVKLGVESLQKHTLDFIQKPYREPEMAIQAIKLLKKYNLSPVCFICIGFPGDTEESILADLKILKELKVKLRVQILWAYPGCDFQGKGLPQELLKKIQQEAMSETNSIAWRKNNKNYEKKELPLWRRS